MAKGLDPLTKQQSEDPSGSKPDRFNNAMRWRIMQMTRDIKVGKGFVTTLRQQRSFLDTKGVDLTE